MRRIPSQFAATWLIRLTLVGWVSLARVNLAQVLMPLRAACSTAEGARLAVGRWAANGFTFGVFGLVAGDGYLIVCRGLRPPLGVDEKFLAETQRSRQLVIFGWAHDEPVNGSNLFNGRVEPLRSALFPTSASG